MSARIPTGWLAASCAAAVLAGSCGGGGSGRAVTAGDLLRLTSSCVPVSGTSPFATDAGAPPSVPICQLSGAVWWTADMDVDCDGKRTDACNESTSSDFQPQTSARDSQGNPLDSAALPYVVIPLPSNGFDYRAAGISLGAVVAVIYRGRLVYGVFGDEGPEGIIGEASVAMARALGADPDPRTGGVDDSAVTYVVFQGADAVVTPVESHSAAERLGDSLASRLLSTN